MKKMVRMFSACMLGFVLGGCSFPFISQTTREDKKDWIANTVVDSNNQLAIDLYFQYKDKTENGPNIFYSPFSISSALAMTYEGAKGQTADEMQKVLHLPDGKETNRTSYEELFTALNKYILLTPNKDEDINNDPYFDRYKPGTPVQLSTANALWTQKDFPFLDSYLQLVEKYYSGKATNMDFVGDSEGSRATINRWVEDKTHNRIKDLIPQGAINGLTRLILTNAIYFKGAWEHAFEEYATENKDFRVSVSDVVHTPTMRQTETFPYMENNLLQMLELPYTGNEVSMLILLPKNDNLPELENNMTLNHLSEWQNQLQSKDVETYIPKFKFETQYLMAQDLEEMGMATAFSLDTADFSLMTGSKDLFIGEVIHKTFLDVNEKGTEAAAATAVFMPAGAAPGEAPPPPPVFRADHPFIFLIRHNETGTILFMGKVGDPS